MSEIYEVNKYGAIHPKHIAKIEDTIQELIKEIRSIREEIGRKDEWFEFVMRGCKGIPHPMFYTPTNSRLKKLEALTNADDYEYVTETKLVKKTKKDK